MQATLLQFAQARVLDALIVKQYVTKMLQQGGLAAPDDAQLAALVSSVLLLAALVVHLMLLVPRGRTVVFETVETILAICLIAILLAVVLGLPMGIIYLVLKAAAFLLNLVLSIPAVAGLVASLRSSLPF